MKELEMNKLTNFQNIMQFLFPMQQDRYVTSNISKLSSYFSLFFNSTIRAAKSIKTWELLSCLQTLQIEEIVKSGQHSNFLYPLICQDYCLIQNSLSLEPMICLSKITNLNNLLFIVLLNHQSLNQFDHARCDTIIL